MAKTHYITLDGTNRSLKRLYRAFNKAFFGGALDTSLTVRFSRKPLRGCNAYYNPVTEEIVIENRFRNSGRIQAWMLLHEMNHMLKGHSKHGKKFDKGMMRLAKAGAFRGIW